MDIRQLLLVLLIATFSNVASAQSTAVASDNTAAAEVTAAIAAAPENAADIVAAAIKATPGQADKIVQAAVSAQPEQAVAIAQAGAKASPKDAAVITAAAISAAPDQASDIIVGVTQIILALSEEEDPRKNIANRWQEQSSELRQQFAGVSKSRPGAYQSSAPDVEERNFKQAASPN